MPIAMDDELNLLNVIKLDKSDLLNNKNIDAVQLSYL